MGLSVGGIDLGLRKGPALVRDNRAIGIAGTPTTLAVLGKSDFIHRKTNLICDVYVAARIHHLAAQWGSRGIIGCNIDLVSFSVV